MLNHLNDAWLASPSLRLGQLINILTTDSSGVGLIPDDELLERLLRWNEWNDACDKVGSLARPAALTRGQLA